MRARTLLRVGQRRRILLAVLQLARLQVTALPLTVCYASLTTSLAVNAQFGCQFGLSILDSAAHSGCEFSVWLSIPAVICGACREPHCNWCCGCSGEEIFEESDYQQALDAHNKQVDALEVCRSPCLSHSLCLTHSLCSHSASITHSLCSPASITLPLSLWCPAIG